jgi:hypothetical protein
MGSAARSQGRSRALARAWIAESACPSVSLPTSPDTTFDVHRFIQNVPPSSSEVCEAVVNRYDKCPGKRPKVPSYMPFAFI